VRTGNGIACLTARRFSAQDRPGAIRAVNRLKAEAGYRETALAAALTGKAGGWAAGHSGGGAKHQRTGAASAPQLAVAVAERLALALPANLA
jgi:hypothetical protein